MSQMNQDIGKIKENLNPNRQPSSFSKLSSRRRYEIVYGVSFAPSERDQDRSKRQERLDFVRWNKNLEKYREMSEDLYAEYKDGRKYRKQVQEKSLTVEYIERYNELAERYNTLRGSYKAIRDRLNDKIRGHNASLSEDSSFKVKELKLPEELEFLKAADNQSSESSWLQTAIEAVNKLNPKTVLEAATFAAAAFSTMAPLQAEAVTIRGDRCSIESTLHINNNNASLNILAGRIQKYFDKEEVFAKLVERFAKAPCDPARSNIWLDFAPLDKGVDGRIAGNNITFDPDKIGLNPDNGHPEQLLAHELTHNAQNYSSLVIARYWWLKEGIADYAEQKYGPDNRLPLPADLELGNHYTDGYEVAAGYLIWLEQNVNLTEGLPWDNVAKLKNGTIVDGINDMLQGDPDLDALEVDFLRQTNQSWDQKWEEYFKSRVNIPTQTRIETQISNGQQWTHRVEGGAVMLAPAAVGIGLSLWMLLRARKMLRAAQSQQDPESNAGRPDS